jgi:hypothetical protein
LQALRQQALGKAGAISLEAWYASLGRVAPRVGS